MAQRVDNLYRLVTIPAFYRWVQSTLGGQRARAQLAQDVIRAEPGMRLLDVGCGPGTILPYLPAVDYVGVDLNSKHIDAARSEFGGRGQFRVGDVSRMGAEDLGQFDLIVVFAILHHLSDTQSRTLFASLDRFLKPGGRIVTMDNVWLPRQRSIAWLLNRLDSGLNIRTSEQYQALLAGLPYEIETRLYHDLLAVPYDHFCMTLTRAA